MWPPPARLLWCGRRGTGEHGAVDRHVTTTSLAELVSTLSIASDLGMGRPVERVLRQTVIAMRLADAAGVGPASGPPRTTRRCSPGSAAPPTPATWWSSSARRKASTPTPTTATSTPMAMGVFVARHLGRGGPALRRVGMVGRFIATAGRSVQHVMESHCRAAGDFADRLGLGDDVRTPLAPGLRALGRQGRARRRRERASSPWPPGWSTSPTTSRRSTTPAAPMPRSPSRRSAGARSSTRTLVDCFCDHAAEILADLGELSALGRGHRPRPVAGRTAWTTPCSTRRSPPSATSPTSRTRRAPGTAVASPTWPAAAASLARPPERRGDDVRRAGWLHDIGVIGVSSTVWTEPGPWSFGQRERARTAPLPDRADAGPHPDAAPHRAVRGAAPRAARRVRLPEGV